MPYLFLRDAHSLLRWIVLLACVWALLRVWSGFSDERNGHAKIKWPA